MATIRRRGHSWQAQVRRSDQPPVSRSFSKRDDALKWARGIESAIDEGRIWGGKLGKGPTLAELLARYLNEITPTKRSYDREIDKIRVILRHPVCNKTAIAIQISDIIAYRNDRLVFVKPSTVKREIAIIRHCFEIAIREWSIKIKSNPVLGFRLKYADNSRQRLLDKKELERFWVSVGAAKTWYFEPMVILAIETGMRRGEMLSMRKSDINFLENTLSISITKNGHPRVIPLSPKAIQVLAAAPTSGPIFPISKGSLRQSWVRMLHRAKISNFRWHDLRHWAITRFFELGLTIPEVSLISGHRDYKMLARYTHLKAEVVATKLEPFPMALSRG